MRIIFERNDGEELTQHDIDNITAQFGEEPVCDGDEVFSDGWRIQQLERRTHDNRFAALVQRVEGSVHASDFATGAEFREAAARFQPRVIRAVRCVATQRGENLVVRRVEQ